MASAMAATTSKSVSTEALCLQLGWSMQRLYRAHPDEEKPVDELPDRLPRLGRLTRVKRGEIDFGRAQTCLAQIADALSWTQNQIPTIDGIETTLDVFQSSDGRTRPVATSGDPGNDYRKAVLAAHVSLLIKIAAAGATLEKAYNLGRALADTSRPHQ